VTALIAIMKPVTEKLSSMSPNLPLKSHPCNKIRVPLDTGELFFHEKGKPKPFPYLTRQVPNLGIHQMGPSKPRDGVDSELNFLTILQARSTWCNLNLWNMMGKQ
jgi:hypothetical protein